MAVPSSFDQPVRDFLAFARVEAGLAPATIEAYTRDLGDMVRDLEAAGITEPEAVGSELLSSHSHCIFPTFCNGCFSRGSRKSQSHCFYRNSI